MNDGRMTVTVPGHVPELVAAARRQRSRRLVVACADDHRIAEVYGTTRGPILVAELPFTLLLADDDELGRIVAGYRVGVTPSETRREGPPVDHVATHARGTRGAVVLEHEADPAWLDLSCRCRTRRVTAGWLREQLATPRRRTRIE